jgi:outer membrane autotransporter protein
VPTGGNGSQQIIVGTIDQGNATTSALSDALARWSGTLLTVTPDYNNSGFGFNYTMSSIASVLSNKNSRGNLQSLGRLFDNNPTQLQSSGLMIAQIADLESELLAYSAGELSANMLSLISWNPQIRAYDRLAKLNSLDFDSGTMLGQSCSGTSEFWFEGYYSSGEVKDDNNARGYDHSRGGLLVGFDQRFDYYLIAGVVFGYGNPHATNRIGRIEADDFTFGAYAQYRLNNYLFLNSFLGYGSQDYKFKNHKIDVSGDAMYASVELLQQLQYQDNIQLLPLIAIDFQKNWMGKYSYATAGGQVNVNKSSLDQTVLRIGLNSNSSLASHVNLRTRLQYGVQIGGDLYGTTRTSFQNGNGYATLKGVNVGRHRLNTGIGMDVHTSNRTKIFVDYDFDLGRRSTAHTTQLGFVVSY